MSTLPECVEHDRTPVTVMLNPGQAVRLEVLLANHRERGACDTNAVVDAIFELGMTLAEQEMQIYG